ncbi:hypothetical protein [Pendulispora albinea]|uniref:Uncharacterized protein n=1 Tax=Pendulispora albinea TaxID=2741071 RepID=A0ABZ2M8D5_9BACT
MDVDPRVPHRSLFAASLALLAYSTLTAVALAAWFARAIQPWTWNSVLATVSCVLGVVSSAIVWCFPSRLALIAGMAVMLSSLLRVGPLQDWTWVSFTMLVVTTLLLVPLVHALVLLPPSS